MAATDFVTESQIDSLTTNVATAVKANTTLINGHISDGTAAHAASAVSYAGGTGISATDVEGALDELATEKADATALTAHLNDTSDAHDASAISILDTGTLYTATDVEAALAEVMTVANAAAGGGVAINDAVTNTTSTWSSQKSTDYVAAQVAALIDSAPGALDTLNELAAAVGDDAAFSTTVTTALSLRLRFDAAQTLTAPQKAQALANLGIVASTVNFASNFNTLIA